MSLLAISVQDHEESYDCLHDTCRASTRTRTPPPRPRHDHDQTFAALAELGAEVLLAFVTDTAVQIAELRNADAPPIRRIIDIGSGPGVGTCELARRFPEAQVIAVDSAVAMLERTTTRAIEQGLQAQITTLMADLPGGLDDLEPADVIWASMSLHHVGNEVEALRVLRGLLSPYGLIAVAEMAEPMHVLPDALDVGRPGLAKRIDTAGAKWFAQMRIDLTDSVPSLDLALMFTSAGFEIISSQIIRQRLDSPLSDAARRLVLGDLQRVSGLLDDDDRATVAVLTDPTDPRSVMQRQDVFVEASRRLVIAQPTRTR